jgi:Transposase IS116/IS110/IS902 family
MTAPSMRCRACRPSLEIRAQLLQNTIAVAYEDPVLVHSWRHRSPQKSESYSVYPRNSPEVNGRGLVIHLARRTPGRHRPPALRQRVERLSSIDGVGDITALIWALEVGDPHRFASIADAVSYCGLTAALRSSAGKQQRGPLSKQRNAYLQTALIEAAKLAPRWNPYLAQLYAHELERGHANRATVQVARKLVAYLLAVDKSGQPFQVHTPPPKTVPTKKKTSRRLARAA